MKLRVYIVLAAAALAAAGCSTYHGGASDDFDYTTNYGPQPGGPHFKASPQSGGMDPTDIRDAQSVTKPNPPVTNPGP